VGKERKRKEKKKVKKEEKGRLKIRRGK